MPDTELRGLGGKSEAEIRLLVENAVVDGKGAVFAHIRGDDKSSIAAIIKLGFGIEGENRDEIVFSLYPGASKP